MAAAAVENPGNAYEEMRRRQVEENKKKMELLNLSKLSASLLEASPRAKSSPAKQLKRKIRQEGEFSVPVELRRSNRVAKLPATNYREVAAYYHEEGRPKRSYRIYKQTRDLSGRVYASDEAREYAYNRADDVDAGLEGGFPSFVKPMTQSHVTGGFWLGLPVTFCRKHLPRKDETLTLIDENGESSETLFLARKAGLSAGWRGFSLAHELIDGDALVFQLVNRTTFKVYIIRASSYSEDDDDAAEA